MQITIVIPRVHADEPIVACLKSVQSAMTGAEILVVDMAYPKLDTIAAGKRVSCIVSPRLSASQARNFGARHALTPYILFLDGDCIIEANVSGNSSLNKSFTAGADLIILQRAEAERRIQPAKPTKYNFSLHCIEWNCIWRREHFLALSGFDERLGPGSPTMAQTGEAFSLCYKHFAMRNARTEYMPEILVHHPSLDNAHNPTKRQLYAYGSHYAAFEPLIRAPSMLAAYWFLRTLGGFGKDLVTSRYSFRARAMALYDSIFLAQPRKKSDIRKPYNER